MPNARTRALPVLILLCVIQFMLILDMAVVNIGLPSMQSDLGISPENLQWVISGYVLTFGGFLLLGGRAGDLYGRRRLFLSGLVVFTAASLAGGLAQTPDMLIGARLVQGVGAAMVAPAAMSLLTTTFHEGAERNRALGVWGAVSAGGGAAGIIIGGVLTELSWRWVLMINVPIGVVALAMAPHLLAESRDEEARHLDLPGAVLVTGSMIGVVYGLSQAPEAGFGSASVITSLALGVALLALFLVVESRATEALVPLHIFRQRNVSGGNAVAVLMLATMVSITYFLTLYVQQLLGYSPLEAGLAFLPQALLIMVVANMVVKVVPRIGVRKLMAGALAVIGLGALILTQISPEGNYFAVVLPGLLVTGVGLGTGFVAASIAVTTGVSEHEQGLASGMFITAQQLGAAIGLAVMVTVASLATDNAAVPADVITGFQWGIAACVVVALLGIVISLLAVREPAPPGAPEQPAELGADRQSDRQSDTQSGQDTVVAR